MLDTDFPRPVGDIGNRNSFSGIPMRFAKVPKASAERVLSSDPDHGLQSLLPEFLAQARILEAQGALGITSSCGFLAPLQQKMASLLTVPVALSSLLQVAWAQSLLPEGKVCGVITIDAERLTPRHLSSLGAAGTTPIVGMPRSGAFAELILGNSQNLAQNSAALSAGASLLSRSTRDFSHEQTVRLRRLINAELIAAAKKLPSNTGAIVLECTNLPPYRAVLKAYTKLPVYDIQTMVRWFWAGLSGA